MVATVGTIFPGDRQWAGVARELITGTPVAPVITVPVDKPEPDDKPTFLQDKGMRGSMGEEYGEILGTEIADFSFNGNVYLDNIGHFLFNLMGDYSATGSTPTNSTTFTAPLAVGATTGTLTSSTGYSVSSVAQIGSGSTAEVVQFTGLAGSVATWANNPCRYAHATTPAVATVVAPFTHTFSLLNSGNGQPP